MQRITKVLVSGAATAAIVAGTVGAARAVTVDRPTDAAAPTAHVRVAAGDFAYEVSASGSSITDVEHFGGISDGFGTSGRPSVDADGVRSMGHVAGGTSFENGVSGAHLSGVAGDDVTAITVTPASGAPVPATLDGGVWAAAWQGDPGADGGRAAVEFTTADGARHTTSTDDVDWIAADQRAAEQG